MAELTPGTELPVFARTTDLDIWNRFAAVNDEYVPIHMDDQAGRDMGFPGAIGMGALLWSYVHNMLRDWMDGNGRIVRVSTRYQAPNLRGSTVTVLGTVNAAEKIENGQHVTITLSVTDETGRQLMQGDAVVSLRS